MLAMQAQAAQAATMRWQMSRRQVFRSKDQFGEFAAAIRGGRAPVTDGAAGLRVLSVLEAAQTSLRARGALVEGPDRLAIEVLQDRTP